MQFYNLKTKERVEISEDNIELVEMPNGRMAATTEHNGMKMFKFLGKADADKLIASGKVPTKQAARGE